VQLADAIPNLLIALREGLEAGMVVTILLAAVRKLEGKRSTLPIWLGVLGAASLAASFAAVLTYSTTVLDSRAQQLIAGVLSIVSVVLVTWMVFWMRSAARGLSGELTRKVADTALIGAGALALTAFFAVAREGLETTLFIWSAVKASGSTVAPVVGAGVGLALAIVLCWLLYRGAVRVNLGVFFSRTAIVLLVIAAGVLAYGLGDLQDAGVLPGGSWVLFDFSGTPAGDSWWMALITGITALRPRMTMLQGVAWVVYLGVALPAYLRRPRAKAVRAEPAAASAVEADSAAPRTPGWWERTVQRAERRIWLTASVLIVVPALIAVGAIALLPSGSASATTVSVTPEVCGQGWSGGAAGVRTFAVANQAAHPVEVRLLDSAGAIVGEIETLGPGTTATMTASLASGSYSFTCLSAGSGSMSPVAASVAGAGGGGTASRAIKPVTVADLTPYNDAYQRYASGRLATVSAAVSQVQADLAAGDRDRAQADWLTAQTAWERVGASYNSFGDRGVAVDGLPTAFPKGVADPGFTGLHRLEYGLWHGEGMASLQAVAATLQAGIADVTAHLGDQDVAGDPTNLTLRVHEILEDAIRDHLSGNDDQGGGAGYAMTDADLDATLTVLNILAPLVEERTPGVVATARSQLETARQALAAARSGAGWPPVATAPLSVRQRVNAAVGAAVETLSGIPGVLEVPRV
jgi:high-affinity iron transporter